MTFPAPSLACRICGQPVDQAEPAGTLFPDPAGTRSPNQPERNHLANQWFHWRILAPLTYLTIRILRILPNGGPRNAVGAPSIAIWCRQPRTGSTNRGLGSRNMEYGVLPTPDRSKPLPAFLASGRSEMCARSSSRTSRISRPVHEHGTIAAEARRSKDSFFSIRRFTKYGTPTAHLRTTAQAAKASPIAAVTPPAGRERP